MLKQFGQKDFFRGKGFALLNISLPYVKLYIAARPYLNSLKYSLAGSCRSDVFNAIQRRCSKREIPHLNVNSFVLLCAIEVGKNKQRLGLGTPLTVFDVLSNDEAAPLTLVLRIAKKSKD